MQQSGTGTRARQAETQQKKRHWSRDHHGVVYPGGSGSRHRALSSAAPEGGLASHTLQFSVYQFFFFYVEMLRAVCPFSRAKDDDRESCLLEKIPIRALQKHPMRLRRGSSPAPRQRAPAAPGERLC